MNTIDSVIHAYKAQLLKGKEAYEMRLKKGIDWLEISRELGGLDKHYSHGLAKTYAIACNVDWPINDSMMDKPYPIETAVTKTKPIAHHPV